jgi:nucleoside-diphosphate-sugar epimerase
MAKKTVFLTGASGSMGGEAFKELWLRKNRFNIILLLLPGARERRLYRKYEKKPGIKIIWGDITRYEDVLQGVKEADYVLNTAAIISPAADHHPELAWKVNYQGVLNIIRAIQARPDGGAGIKYVNMASVAMTGDRRGKIHLGRVGDPLKPSIFDIYSLTKIAAERALIESGLKYWVSLRMSYIAIPNTLSLLDPIMFHQPLDTYGDLITKRDAGYMIVNACEDNVPEEFWGRVYNASGGPAARFYYEEYLRDVMKLVGLGDYRKLMDRNWFCLQNFHCHYYEDSHILNHYLKHQRDSLQDHYRQIVAELPFYLKIFRGLRLSKVIPPFIIKHLVMKPMAHKAEGPAGWIRNENTARVKAFYGSPERFAAIGKWDNEITAPAPEPERLNHGYDETKPDELLNLTDMKKAAQFRGGECLAETMTTGDLRVKLQWRCAFGHEFSASPYLILKAGHWCPECTPPPWNYDQIAKHNPFFAQVWDFEENNHHNNDGRHNHQSVLVHTRLGDSGSVSRMVES